MFVEEQQQKQKRLSGERNRRHEDIITLGAHKVILSGVEWIPRLSSSSINELVPIKIVSSAVSWALLF